MKKLILSLFLALITLNMSLSAQDFTAAAEKSVHSVVYIQCQYEQQTSYYDDFFYNDFFNQFFSMDPFGAFDQREPRQKSRTLQTSGSGVIISSDGYIVTNNHVVADADSITVTLNDRTEYSAKIIGTDPNNDLAVIKIDETNLPAIEYGNSDEVKIGQWVLAVGNPFNLTSTVTAGIVSAKARNINILSSKGQAGMLTSFIQTDAAMNPGNSGGALVDLEGKLIGINAAIASNTGSYTGYSFAIPVNIAKKVINDIIKYGSTQSASAGLTTQEIDSKLQKEKKLNNNQGVYVANVVKDGASDKAGIKEGDVIKKINGKKVTTVAELSEVMAQLSPNESATFEIERAGQSMTKNVSLLDKKKTAEIEANERGPEIDAQGLTLREISSQEKQEYQLSKGLVVTKTGKGRLASQGIKKGFIITAIDGKVNLNMSDAKALANKKGKTTIEGFYPNSNRSYYFVIVL